MRIIFLSLIISGPLNAAVIERPAGDLPGQRANASSIGATSVGIAKSKVIPLPRKMDIARSPKNLNQQANGSQSVAAKPIRNGAANALPSAVATYAKNIAVGPAKPKLDGESNSVPAIKRDNAQPDAESESMSNIEPWGSVSKRFSDEDPAKAVTQGVRVEDIIEPTSDYQYSAGRKKNPFIPDLVRRRSAIQKELSPNDVEIPIINPLQSFALNQLAVIGVWEGGDHIWKALIQTPTNQGIETKLGDPAGSSGGRIMSINPDAVVVREFKVRVDGTREYRDVPLYMGSDKPRDSDEVVGGRLILKPGASAPEIEKPDSPAAVVAPTPELLPTGVSGTLKNRVSVEPSVSQSDVNSTTSDQTKDGAVSTLPAPTVQGGAE